MATLEASGTQTATVGTEHTLSSQTAFKLYQLQLDVSALAAGERVEISIKTKILAGGALALHKRAVIRGPASQPVFVSVPLASDIQYDVTLKQIGGTGRAFPWKVFSL